MKSTKAVMTLVVAGCLWVMSCSSQDNTPATSKTIVMILDLSKSIPQSEHELNKQFITQLLHHLDTGDELYVLGLTASSFGKPTEILHARLPVDAHPLQAKFLRAREELVATWQKKAPSLVRHSQQSDVVGAIAYAELLFAQSSGEKWLIMLSDMRHSSNVLNIENKKVINADASLARLKESGFMPDLSGTKVVVLGAHTHGKHMSPAYYESLRVFWEKFFTAANAELLSFQPGRNWQFNSKPVGGVF